MEKRTFAKATKAKARARVALYGPSGGGKTYSALAIAQGLVDAGKRVAVIDTEHAAASKYSDRFDFDTLTLDDPRVEDVIESMEAASSAGYGVVIIDSLTHAWQKLLDEVDATVKASRSSNSFAAWREHTPRQKRLVDAILSSPCHVIATIRAKTEWTQEQNDKGKLAPRRVGLTPEQGKGIEFEFDLLIAINAEHYATVEKDRSGKFQDKIIEKPGVEFGKSLAEWLSDGVDVPSRPKLAPVSDLRELLTREIEQFVHLERTDPAFRAEVPRVMEWIGHPGVKIGTMDADAITAARKRLSDRITSGDLFADVPTA